MLTRGQITAPACTHCHVQLWPELAAHIIDVHTETRHFCQYWLPNTTDKKLSGIGRKVLESYHRRAGVVQQFFSFDPVLSSARPASPAWWWHTGTDRHWGGYENNSVGMKQELSSRCTVWFCMWCNVRLYSRTNSHIHQVYNRIQPTPTRRWLLWLLVHVRNLYMFVGTSHCVLDRAGSRSVCSALFWLWYCMPC